MVSSMPMRQIFFGCCANAAIGHAATAAPRSLMISRRLMVTPERPDRTNSHVYSKEAIGNHGVSSFDQKRTLASAKRYIRFDHKRTARRERSCLLSTAPFFSL
jgi:hypothetical protein